VNGIIDIGGFEFQDGSVGFDSSSNDA